jgi:hypothetical protein
MSYYIGPAGKPGATGMHCDPYSSLAVAMAAHGGGQTYVLLPGFYPGPLLVPAGCGGTAAAPTVIKSEAKWQAVVNGSGSRAGSFVCDAADGLQWITWSGLEVTAGRDGGIALRGDYCEVSDCYVHSNQLAGIDSAQFVGTRVLRNLVEYNGSNPQYCHGIYVGGDQLTIMGNIVRHNSGFGIHLMPAATGCLIAQNLVYGHNFRAGVVLNNPMGGKPSRFLNNTVAHNAFGALELWGDQGHKLRNNILYGVVPTDDPVLDGQYHPVAGSDADYNTCLPASTQQGAHGQTASSSTPMWVLALTGAYWLTTGSPAIGAGQAQPELTTDFWGRPLPAGAPDSGAMAYVPALELPAARAGWYGTWSYRYQPVPGEDVPDFWAPPT